MTRARAAEGAMLAGLIALAGLVCSRNLETAPSYDEGVYLASMDALRHGQTLGSEVFASQPPGFYVLLQAVGLWADSLTGARIAFLVLALVGFVAAYFVGRAYGRVLGGVGAVATLALAPVFPSEAPRVAADVPSVALSLVAVALAVYGFRRRTLSLAAPAGAVFALAVSVKLLAVVAIVPLVAVAVAERARPRLVAAAAGAAGVVAVAFLIAYAGVLGELWEGVVTFHADAREYPGEGAGRIVELVDWETPFAWALPLGAAMALAASVRAPLRVWPVWAWAGAALLFTVFQKPLFDHHLVLLYGVLAVAVGTSVGGAARVVMHGRTMWALLALGALIVVAGYVQQMRRIDYAVRPTDPSITFGVETFRACTGTEDVVVSDQPVVAFLAGRRMPGELVDTSLVRLRTGGITNAEILRILDRDNVRAVFVGRSFEQRTALLGALLKRYPTEKQHPGATVYGC